MSRVRKNTYQVVWEHKDGHQSTSTGIDVDVYGDVVMEHIRVLVQFHSIFTPPAPVAKILRVELIKENW